MSDLIWNVGTWGSGTWSASSGAGSSPSVPLDSWPWLAVFFLLLLVISLRIQPKRTAGEENNKTSAEQNSPG